MSNTAALANDEIAYLCGMLHGHFATILAARASMERGSEPWDRAGIAESATGWLLGWLQDEVLRRGMVSEVVLGDIDAALREILERDIDDPI